MIVSAEVGLVQMLQWTIWSEWGCWLSKLQPNLRWFTIQIVTEFYLISCSDYDQSWDDLQVWVGVFGVCVLPLLRRFACLWFVFGATWRHRPPCPRKSLWAFQSSSAAVIWSFVAPWPRLFPCWSRSRHLHGLSHHRRSRVCIHQSRIQAP